MLRCLEQGICNSAPIIIPPGNDPAGLLCRRRRYYGSNISAYSLPPVHALGVLGVGIDFRPIHDLDLFLSQAFRRRVSSCVCRYLAIGNSCLPYRS